MTDSSITRPSLLLRIRNLQDDAAWSQFVEIYAPIVFRYARKQGLQDADAADITQEVLTAVARSAKAFDYDPKRGTFRGWLLTISRNKLRSFLARQRAKQQGTGDTAIQTILYEWPEDRPEDGVWDQEYEQQLFRLAVREIRGNYQESTWQAFWQTALEGKSGKQVAEALGMTIGAVYIAKSRVSKGLKERIERFERENL